MRWRWNVRSARARSSPVPEHGALGAGHLRADAAARAYFGKRPGALTPLEAAWLAAILPNPTQGVRG